MRSCPISFRLTLCMSNKVKRADNFSCKTIFHFVFETTTRENIFVRIYVCLLSRNKDTSQNFQKAIQSIRYQYVKGEIHCKMNANLLLQNKSIVEVCSETWLLLLKINS